MKTLTFIIFAILLLISTALFAQNQTIHEDTGRVLTVAGHSMTPTLKPGDQVRLHKCDGDTVKHGDLIAIKLKTRKQMMVKRVIAIAGDKIEFINGRPRINNSWLNTRWWPEDRQLKPRSYRILVLQLSRHKNTIPYGNLIVMGDNSSNSFDSGDFGMVAVHQVIGTVQKLE